MVRQFDNYRFRFLLTSDDTQIKRRFEYHVSFFYALHLVAGLLEDTFLRTGTLFPIPFFFYGS